ncbi:MAG: HEAT repeat domain-containing protein [Planctomycetota bacterium]
MSSWIAVNLCLWLSTCLPTGTAAVAMPGAAAGRATPSTQPTTQAVAGEAAPSSQPTTQAAAETPTESETMVESAAGSLSGKELDELLSLVTGNNTADARKLGAKKLLDVGTDAANERLASVLRQTPPDHAAQIAVCRAVAESPQPQPTLVDPLISLLGGGTDVLDAVVIDALRVCDNGRVVDRLRPIAADGSQHKERRQAAIRALGALGENMKAVAALIELAGAENGDIQAAALVAFRHATGTKRMNLETARAWWSRHASMSSDDWLRAINRRHLAEIRELRARTNVLTERLIAAYREAYVRLPEGDHERQLVLFLEDGLPEVREFGLDLVNAMITDRKEVGQEIKTRLAEMISDSQEGLRLKVALIVGDLRLTGSVSRLVQALEAERDSAVRAAFANAIGRLDGLEAVDALIGRLGDEAPSVVGEAALALANIARRTMDADPQVAARITVALLDRLKSVQPSAEDLRVKFLDAMSRIGSEPFRKVFGEEMASQRSVPVRRAAIAGLAGFGDAAAAAQIRPLTSAPEPEIRAAAAGALGKCGQGEADLAVLVNRLDGNGEPDATVRQRAWEAYVLVAQRLPAQDHLRIAEQFAVPNDEVSQRRQLELLTALRNNPKRFEQVGSGQPDGRVTLLESMADAHEQLGEFAAAAAALTQATDLLQDRADPRFVRLTSRAVSLLITGGEIDMAVRRIKESAAERDGSAMPDKTPLAEAVLRGIQARVDAIRDAATYADATRFIESMFPVRGQLGGDFEVKLDAARNGAEAKRNAVIAALLDSVGSDEESAEKLKAFGAQAVLPAIHARLSAMPTTTAPATPVETALVGVAKHLAPAWPGYPPSCSPAERAAALKKLESLWATPAENAPEAPKPPTTAPTS